MAYEKQTFTTGQVLEADHLNHMEEGIAAAVSFEEQTLTLQQKAQVRRNIGVGESSLNTFIQNSDIDHAYDPDSGAYYTVIRIYKQKMDGSYQYPFVYAPTYNGDYGTTAINLAENEGFLLTANAGIFTMSSPPVPDGILIQNSEVLANAPSTTHPNCKPLTIDKNGDLGFAAYDADANNLVAAGIVSAVCGFMPIIENFEAVPSTDWNSVSHYNENAQRQIIGQWGNGDYAIVTCEGRGYHGSDGWTIEEAQAVCQKLGLKFAYNLDGGGSTETMLGLKPINTVYEGSTGRVVPTFIVFNGSTKLSNKYSVTFSLVNVTSSYNGKSVEEGAVYTTTLTSQDGTILTDVVVKMGDVDITSEVYSDDGVIFIPEVTGNLYISAAGVLNVALPSGYTNKAYIQANGNQYADSLISVNGIEECGIEYMAEVNKQNGVDGSGHILSCGYWYTPFIRFYGEPVVTQLLTKRHGNEINTTIDIDTSKPCVVKAFIGGGNGVYIDDTLIHEVQCGTATATGTLWLCAYDGPDTKRFRFSGKIYYIKIFDSENGVAYHFVPCTNSDGVAGLYEIVNGRFFASESDTAFTTHT